ncbi:hypothetical protein CgunFtcFv8_014008 [Champsocephalus gunnari]|uniref:Uncharacterized protein n=1 Tax=Champsocephalus gunnari TaxID=52237 RepID=A0AAN8E4E4_CHAGU|nr:hypothetical protein CgunFtcFv8_014008 [Champsocephalus gunnari]
MGRGPKALQQGYNELQNKIEQSQLEISKTLEDLKRTEAELDTCTSQLDEAQKQASVAIAERSTMEQNAQHREASMKAEAEQTWRFRLGGELKEMELRLDEVDRSGTMTPGQESSISGPGSWSGSTAHNGRKAGAPKLDSQWVGLCRVLERVGVVVYRVQLPPKGRKVGLHRDRLAPYRGVASPQAQGTPATPVLLTPVPLPRRQSRPPGRFRDFVW